MINQQEKTIEELKSKFKLTSYNSEIRLSEIFHTSHYQDLYLDDFVYELARELSVSVDYLYGWSEEPNKFLPASQYSKTKQKVLKDILLKYSSNQNVDFTNTNILAYECNVDRNVLEYLLRDTRTWSKTITTSYCIVDNISKRFKLDTYKIMDFLVDADVNPKAQQILEWYKSKK